MSFAVPVLEMCLDVLYFHSCGIVGIMMVMIKLAHRCAVLLCCFIFVLFFLNCMLNVSCGVFNTASWRRDSTQSAVVSIHPNTLNVCAGKKKKEIWNKRSPFNNTACDCAYNVKKKETFVNASKPCCPGLLIACTLYRCKGIVGDHT